MVRPLYGVEVFEGETARFEVELSEDDVHGQWKLNGEVLSPSAVRLVWNILSPAVTFTFIFTQLTRFWSRMRILEMKVNRSQL